MYIKEMHIEVNQGVQKLAANLTRKIFPQEIDWILNKNIERFIKSHMKPKENGSFEVTQLGMDALRKLIVYGHPLPAYVASATRVYGNLPYLYSYLLSDNSTLVRKCAGVSFVTESRTLYLAVLPIPLSTRTTPKYYTEVRVRLNGTTIFNITDESTAQQGSYTGYDSKDEVFSVRSRVIHSLNVSGHSVYWEQFGTLLAPRRMILVSSTPITTASIVVDGTETQALLQTMQVQVRTSTGDTSVGVNRLTPVAKVNDLLRAAFWETQADSPLSHLSGATISVHTNESFIVTNVEVAYVRKARKVDLILGQDCELAEDFHQEICDLSVEYIKTMIQDPGWQLKMADNMKRTTLP